MSQRVSISARLLKGGNSDVMCAYNPFIMNDFHAVSSGKTRPYSLSLMFGKARLDEFLEMGFERDG